MQTIPEGPICVIGLDSKYKADLIIEAKAGSQNLLMWPEVRDHPIPYCSILL